MQEEEEEEEEEGWWEEGRKMLEEVGPEVMVNNPQVGETLYNGAIALVRWTANVDVSKVDILLSDGTVVLEGGRVEGGRNGTYYWKVDAAQGASYTLSVHAYPADGSEPLVDVSDVFAIQDQTSVKLITPARDAIVIMGEATTITWTTHTTGALTNVILSVIAATTGATLVTFGTQPNSGSYLWVPSSTLTTGRFSVLLSYSPSSRANVTVRGPSFRLRQPAAEGAVTLLSPSVDESLESGKPYTIKWTSPASVTNATLFLTQPGTGLNVQLYGGLDENSFVWVVGALPENTQAAPGSGYQLQLFDASANGEKVMNATSDPFSIYVPQPFVEITSMFDGQDGAMWARGRNATIAFEASDPSDTLTLELQDENGAVVFVVTTEAQVSKGSFTFALPYVAPPSDCFSCFLVAVSNRYPSIYHTFPTPFSIGSHEHSDLAADQTPPSLTLLTPTDRTILHRGSQISITWTGILISDITILLSNHTSGETLPLAFVENTGLYEWEVPLDPAAVGIYDLALMGPQTGLLTPPVRLTIVDPSTTTPSLALAAEPALPSVWSEGDVITVAYTSEGLANPVTVQIYSTELGLLATITEAASTSGSYQFIAPAPPRDPVTDAYLLLSTPAGARAQSSPFTFYQAQGVHDVTLPATTLYKGLSYGISWRASGVPFPVAVLLYSGTPDRLTVSEQACVPWRDATGHRYHGCVLSYDLTNEMCATEVDDSGLWVAGGQCQPLSSTFKLILDVIEPTTPLPSTDGQTTFQLPASATELPSPGSPYSIVVAAATSGLKHEARSADFSIGSPSVLLGFFILQTQPNTRLDGLHSVLLTFLSTVLLVDPSRLAIELDSVAQDDPTVPAQYLVQTSITPASSFLDRGAYEAAQSFLSGWANPSSPLYQALEAQQRFKLVNATEPSLSFLERAGAETIMLSPIRAADVEPLSYQPGGGQDKGDINVGTPMGEEGGKEEGGPWKGKGIKPLVGVLGGFAVLFGVLVAVFLGVYIVRRRRPQARRVLRVQQSGM